MDTTETCLDGALGPLQHPKVVGCPFSLIFRAGLKAVKAACVWGDRFRGTVDPSVGPTAGKPKNTGRGP